MKPRCRNSITRKRANKKAKARPLLNSLGRSWPVIHVDELRRWTIVPLFVDERPNLQSEPERLEREDAGFVQ
jgi:hypothetical protein